MSENKKLLNALISFVIVGFLFLGSFYVMNSVGENGGDFMNQYLSQVNQEESASFDLFMFLITTTVVYFIFKYLISDVTKAEFQLKLKNMLKIKK